MNMRLPTTSELNDADIHISGDHWTPVLGVDSDIETGRRDGWMGHVNENSWANIGDRAYQIEYPSWGLNNEPLSYRQHYYYTSNYNGDHNGEYYIGERMNYYDCESYCETLGGNVACVIDDTQHADLQAEKEAAVAAAVAARAATRLSCLSLVLD